MLRQAVGPRCGSALHLTANLSSSRCSTPFLWIPAPFWSLKKRHASSIRALSPVNDYSLLAASARAVNRAWVPSKVQAVSQTGLHAVALSLKTAMPEKSAWLYLDWKPEGSYVGLGGEPLLARDAGFPGAPKDAMTHLLQSHLVGSTLAGVELPATWESILKLRLTTGSSEFFLYLETVGRQSTAIFTNSQDTILWLGSHQVEHPQLTRGLIEGQQYSLPPAGPGVSPDSVADCAAWRGMIEEEIRKMVCPSLRTALVQSFRGVSFSLADEICSLSGIAADSLGSDDDSAWRPAWETWQRWVVGTKSGELTPYSNTWSWLEPADAERIQLEDLLYMVHDVHEKSSGRFLGDDALNQFEEERKEAGKRMLKGVQRLERRVSLLKKSLLSMENASALRKQADMLMSYAHQWRPGTAKLTVDDWDLPGETITLHLADPNQSPFEAAKELYSKARKASRGAATVGPLIEEAEFQLQRLREAETQLLILDGPTDRAMIQDILDGVRELLMEKQTSEKGRRAKRRTKEDTPGFRRFSAPISGATILVGHSSTQNDQLSTRLAADCDIWMHARDVPGAHVVLRASRGNLPERQDLEFCADLAAWYSGARRSTSVNVTVARAGDITKPKRASKGQVIVRRELMVIEGRPDRGQQVAEEAT